MNSEEIRNRFLNFFEKREHKIIQSASLIPENDPSVLFTTAGMHPLVPYLLGQKHPLGNKLANVQKCVRTGDIDEVGDNRHCTFFEMLGNWSFGDYFKEKAIEWSYEFLTNKEEGLGLEKERLYVTVFEGDENAPRDEEALKIWSKYIPKERVYFLPAKNNWWQAGDNGPCGPDTEIFYDISEKAIGDMTHEEFVLADEEGRVLEIWNNVFMEYEKKDGKVTGKLSLHNVDTGMGLERITMVKNGFKTVFDTDLFDYIFKAIHLLKPLNYSEVPARIIADHIRTAVFMVSDDIIPSNSDRGYVLRRLIRRAVRFADVIGLPKNSLGLLAKSVIDKYYLIYSKLEVQSIKIQSEINKEEEKFRQTLEKGLKEFDKGTDPFVLFTTYGFPVEMTEELAKEKGQQIDKVDFFKKMEEHQKLSQTSSAGMFKGGLADTGEESKKLHTATHLLNAALREIVSSSVAQKGSNITAERLRFDFACDHKLTDQEKQKVEDWVNDKIKRNLKVVHKEMPLEEAEKLGAQMEFGSKYPPMVSIYLIEDESGNYISKEFCGGPHVTKTGELGIFKIIKEEAVASGIRRIKATI